MIVRLRVLGRVQGVGYRAWTSRHAARLGLSGWVRNRSDGSVEAVLCGAADAVQEMIRRCRQGPSWARVDALREEVETVEPEPGFRELPSV